jgi:hypothetical protein
VTVPPDAPPTREAGSSTQRPFQFYFGRFVTTDQQTLVRSSLELTAAYLEDAAGIDPVECRVFAVEDLTSLAAARDLLGPEGAGLPLDMIARRLRFISAEAYLDNIFINTSSPYWQGLSDAQRLRAVSHEYFHVVQMSLLGEERAKLIFTTPPDRERAEGPTWLFEGSAEYISWRFTESLSLGDMEAYIALEPPHPVNELRDLETYVDFAGEEDRAQISLRAVALLLKERDETALTGFYRLLNFGITWRDAFRFSFGRTIDAFYEEYRLLYG